MVKLTLPALSILSFHVVPTVNGEAYSSFRKKADYNDNLTGLEKEAEITIERAKTIIKEIDTRKAGPY